MWAVLWSVKHNFFFNILYKLERLFMDMYEYIIIFYTNIFYFCLHVYSDLHVTY